MISKEKLTDAIRSIKSEAFRKSCSSLSKYEVSLSLREEMRAQGTLSDYEESLDDDELDEVTDPMTLKEMEDLIALGWMAGYWQGSNHTGNCVLKLTDME